MFALELGAAPKFQNLTFKACDKACMSDSAAAVETMADLQLAELTGLGPAEAKALLAR